MIENISLLAALAELRAVIAAVVLLFVFPPLSSFFLPSVSSLLFSPLSNPLPFVVYVFVTALICRYFASGGHCGVFVNLSGQTGVVTGPATGIGWHTTVRLAAMGMDVWIGVRGEERAARVAKEIEQEAEKELEKEREKRKKNGDSEGLKQLPKNSGKVFGRDLDLSSFASIKRFASSVATHQDKIDLLVNNAGIMNTPYGLTTDGFEIQMGTNHFGHFYLTQLLLPKILKAGKSRILNVSSVAFWAAGGGIDYESQLNPITYNPMKAYGMSKLLNIYFTRSLHQRYHSLGVNSTCLHPGSVNTELTKHSMSDILKRLGYPVIFCFFKTAKEGAQNSLHCALANDIVSGSYYCDTRRIELEGAPADAKAAEEWWNRSEKMVKEIVDKIEQNKETK